MMNPIIADTVVKCATSYAKFLTNFQALLNEAAQNPNIPTDCYVHCFDDRKKLGNEFISALANEDPVKGLNELRIAHNDMKETYKTVAYLHHVIYEATNTDRNRDIYQLINSIFDLMGEVC